MRTPRTLLALALAFPLATFADGDSKPRTIESYDVKFAALARTLQQRNWNFDQIFLESCKTVLTNVDKNPKLRLDDQVRAMFGGLWLWTRDGGLPVLQGRNDWALHFIGGGAFEGYWDVGRSAAVIKEQNDTKDPNNFYDLDDLAATMLGARWVDVGTSGDNARNRRWVELWSSGHYTISRSLPRLQYGHMPPGKEAPPEKVQAIQKDVEAALKLPAEPAK